MRGCGPIGVTLLATTDRPLAAWMHRREAVQIVLNAGRILEIMVLPGSVPLLDRLHLGHFRSCPVTGLAEPTLIVVAAANAGLVRATVTWRRATRDGEVTLSLRLAAGLFPAL